MSQPLDSSTISRRLTPAGVVVLYAIFSALWIIASGVLLTVNVDDPALQRQMELAKGLLFVLATSGLLYLLLRQWRDPVPESMRDLAAPVIPRPSKFRWHASAFAFLSMLVPLAGYVVVQVHGPQIEREAFANLEAVAQLKSRQIETWLEERDKDGAVIMAMPGFIELVTALQQPGGGEVRDDVKAQLLSTMAALKYDAALLVDVQGNPLLDDASPRMSAQAAALLPVALATARTLRGEIMAEADGRLYLDFVVPLFVAANGNRRAVGAVILQVAPERFLFPYIQHWPTASASGETLLVRRDGDSVLFINELRHRSGRGLSLRIPLAGIDSRSLVGAAAVAASTPGRLQGNDYRGVPVLAASRSVAKSHWVVLAKLDRDEVMAPLRDLAFWVSLVALLALSAVSAVMLVLWRQRARTLHLEMETHSVRLLRHFYDLPFIGIAMSSPTTKHWSKCNDYLCEILGYSREEMIRTSWADMTHPDDLAANVVEFDRVMRGESEGYALDKRFIRKDGTTVFTSIDVKCVRRADGSPEYLLATVQDITDRKLAEARIQRLTRIYAALSECNQAIVRCTSEDVLFPQVCRFAVQLGGMKMAWVGLVDPDTLAVRPVACFGEGTDYLQDVPSSADTESPFGRGATGTAIRELRPVWIQDFMNDPRTAPWHERGARFGWRATAALPLTRNDIAVGALMLCSDEANCFDDDVRRLLIEMAMDISFALTAFAKETDRKRMEVALRESESRFRGLYEKAPLAYQSLDIAGNILEVNEAWLALLGRSRSEVIGRFIGDFLTDVSIETLANEFPKFQTNGRVDGPLFHFVHKDGSQRLLMVNGQIARDKDGNFLRTHCIMTDLTERYKSEEQLRLAAKVFEQSAEGVIVTGPDRNIIMVNRAFSAITGYSAAEVIGQNPRMLASGHHDTHFYRALWATVHTDGHWHGELWNRRKDGEIYPELVSISQVLDADGHVSHYVGIFSDISEHKASPGAHSAAGALRLAHRATQPQPAGGSRGSGAEPGGTQQRTTGAGFSRSRPLQECQRFARASHRGRTAGPGRRTVAAGVARRGYGFAAGGRRVHSGAAGGYGGRRRACRRKSA